MLLTDIILVYINLLSKLLENKFTKTKITSVHVHK